MASICGFELKNMKTFRGHDGQGLTCSIYYKGKRIALYADYATGGESDIEWERKIITPELRQEIMINLEKFKLLYKERIFEMYRRDNMEILIDDLVNQLCILKEYEKVYKAEIKKGIKNICIVVPYYKVEDSFADNGNYTIASSQEGINNSMVKLRASNPKIAGFDLFNSLQSFNV